MLKSFNIFKNEFKSPPIWWAFFMIYSKVLLTVTFLFLDVSFPAIIFSILVLPNPLLVIIATLSHNLAQSLTHQIKLLSK